MLELYNSISIYFNIAVKHSIKAVKFSVLIEQSDFGVNKNYAWVLNTFTYKSNAWNLQVGAYNVDRF